MKKLLALILMAMLLVTAIPALAEDAEPAAASTTAYIFWQDADWWPAAASKEDDYWAPAPATITGEGYYTVGLTAHMPNWFYSGGNHNRGAQKLAIVVADGNDLFPGLYMQITDVRINGESYPCGDVTYGQTGYDNIAEDGTVFWDANDTYGLIYDQWMIDNAGTVGTGATWSSTATPQMFDVFDVSVLNDPQTIEIDFFLSAQQDVKPAGGPDLRVIKEGPESYDKVIPLAGASDTQLDAWLFFTDSDWSVQRTDPVEIPSWAGVSATDDVITGEGEYSVAMNFTRGDAIGIGHAYIVIENGSPTWLVHLCRSLISASTASP